MSRSGYNDADSDYSDWAFICWRGAVQSAIRGKRGQAFLRELIAALDALPEKKLHSNVFAQDGCFCALGAVGAMRGTDMSGIDPEYPFRVGDIFGIADAMAREIMFLNDEGGFRHECPEQRWQRMRDWAEAGLTSKDAGVPA